MNHPYRSNSVPTELPKGSKTLLGKVPTFYRKALITIYPVLFVRPLPRKTCNGPHTITYDDYMLHNTFVTCTRCKRLIHNGPVIDLMLAGKITLVS